MYKAVITTNNFIGKWYKNTTDYDEIYDRIMRLTDNDHEIAQDIASWCELAPVGAVYTFREGSVKIIEM